MESAIDAPDLLALEGWWARLFGEASPGGFPISSTSNALEQFRVVKSGAGTLFGFSGFNNKGTAQFVQVFDLASPPTSGAIPVMVITVPTVANFAVTFGILGRAFRSGIVLANSSTAATQTAGSADCFFDAQYS